MPDRKSPPQTSLITHVPFIPPEKTTLDNRVPVYFLKGGAEEILKIEWVFHAGSYYQPKPLITFAMTNLLKAGTQNKTAAEISEILDFYGAYLQLDAQKDIVSVSVFVLNKNLQPVLDVLQEIIRTPIFPEDECALLLRNQKQQFVINNRKVQHLARAHFSELLFGESHPYGLRPEEDDFGRVDREDLLSFHRDWVHGGNGLCIVSGKIPDGMPEMLNARFGDQEWVRGTTHSSFPELPLRPSQEKSLLISREDALQSAIRTGKLVINRNHPDYHRLMITNALLGGFFGSRLMRNIRQEKGYTYGINSSIVSLRREGYFFIATQVGVEVCTPAVEEIRKELYRLRTLPASSQELQILRNYLSGNYLRSFDGPFSQGDKFKELLIFGLEMDHFDQFLVELKNITPEIIMQTAEKYLHEDSMTEVVAGKK